MDGCGASTGGVLIGVGSLGRGDDGITEGVGGSETGDGFTAFGGSSIGVMVVGGGIEAFGGCGASDLGLDGCCVGVSLGDATCGVVVTVEGGFGFGVVGVEGGFTSGGLCLFVGGALAFGVFGFEGLSPFGIFGFGALPSEGGLQVALQSTLLLNSAWHSFSDL